MGICGGRLELVQARFIVASLPVDAVTVFDEDLRHVAVGGTDTGRLGLAVRSAEGRTLAEVFSPRTVSLVEPHYRAALEGRASRLELDHEELTYVLRIAPIENERSAVVGGVVVIENITDLRRSEARLRHAEAKFRVAVDNAPVGIALVSLDGHITECNEALAAIIGRSAEELVGASTSELTHPDDIDADRKDVRRLLAGELRSYQVEKRYIHRDGRYIWSMLSTAIVRGDAGEPLYFVSQVEDISERKENDARMRFLAEHDRLTGLVNRSVFEQHIARQLERRQRSEDAASVLMIDLDDFKSINDTYGHTVGDAVLRQVSSAISRRVRSSDVAARIGGDEFAVFLHGAGPAEAAVVARSIAAAIAEEVIDVGAQTVSVHASVGVAPLRQVGSLSEADAAMYAAKRQGGNRAVLSRGASPDEFPRPRSAADPGRHLPA